MPRNDLQLKRLLHKGPFMQFLISQGISNIGDSFRFIALTMVLLKLTGSGMSASLGVLFSVLPSLTLSPFAGTIGDILPAKYLMSLLDFFRGLVTILFISCNNVNLVFILVIITSSIDTIYNPLRRKIIVNLIGRDGLINANSILTGLSGAAFLIGPVLAGILTDLYGADIGFLIAVFSYLITSVIILFIKVKPENSRIQLNNATSGLLQETLKGFEYVRKNKPLTELTVILVIISLCSISMNMAFYPYSFDVLRLTAKGWSLLISVYYGTNLLAAFLLIIPFKRISLKPWTAVYTSLVITALIWQLYGFTQDFIVVLVLQFVEGTILAICGILLTTLLQKHTQNNYMARVAGVNDIGAGVGKIIGMASTYLIIQNDTYRAIFLTSSLILILFIFLLNVFKNRTEDYKL